ncbi:MAG: hypothetical protein HC794_10415 [Nitrospiraceae bacterium]|nr:hypothetical protein [Nitrospiraceae bacterium]
MKSSSTHLKSERFHFTRLRRYDSTSRPNQYSSLWALIGGVVGSTILLWIMVQLGQASSGPKSKTPPMSQAAFNQDAQPTVPHGENDGTGAQMMRNR